MRLALLTAAALLAVSTPARADAPGPPTAPPHAKKRSSPGKPRAPVAIDARLGAGTAHLTIRFEAAAEGVEVRVHGVRGLRVTSAARPLTGASVAAGDVRELDVSFAAPAGQSHLAVTVSGRFAAGQRAAVQSFAVGEPSAAQRSAASRGARSTPAGERIKALPAEEPRR